MRVKNVWHFLPLPAYIKLAWDRITFSKTTTIFFLFSLVHCFVQIVLLIQAFLINDNASHILEQLHAVANDTSPHFALLDEQLTICKGVPGRGACTTIWGPRPEQVELPPQATPSPLPSPSRSNSQLGSRTPHREGSKRDLILTPIENGTSLSVRIEGLEGTSGAVDVSEQCLNVMIWPLQILQNTKREDITLLCFQIWVFGVSLVAILNESIPHIFAAFLTHIVATAWSGVQLVDTAQFRRDFNRLVTQGACDVNFLPKYWEQRSAVEIPAAALSGVALVSAALLSYKLVKAFGWLTFKRIGADLTIHRVYTVVLAFSIVLQLSMFFIVVDTALWLDQLFHGPLGRWAELGTLYRVMHSIVLVLLLPWLIIGWFAVRRERRIMMWIFLGLAILLMAGWGAMFASTTFLWTFRTWRFFSLMTIGAAVLLVTTVVLGVWCRINFGKGLPKYLKGQEPLEGEDFARAYPPSAGEKFDEEKIEYPSPNGPVPIFSASFSATSPSNVSPPPPALYSPGINMHSRTFSRDEDEFGRANSPSPSMTSPVARPAPVVRTAQPRTEYNLSNTYLGNNLERVNSVGSTSSSGSGRSARPRPDLYLQRTTSGTSTTGSAQSKRWVIE